MTRASRSGRHSSACITVSSKEEIRLPGAAGSHGLRWTTARSERNRPSARSTWTASWSSRTQSPCCRAADTHVRSEFVVRHRTTRGAASGNAMIPRLRESPASSNSPRRAAPPRALRAADSSSMGRSWPGRPRGGSDLPATWRTRRDQMLWRTMQGAQFSPRPSPRPRPALAWAPARGPSPLGNNACRPIDWNRSRSEGGPAAGS